MLQQFLIEAVLVCLVGGALGLRCRCWDCLYAATVFYPAGKLSHRLRGDGIFMFKNRRRAFCLAGSGAQIAARLDPVDVLARE